MAREEGLVRVQEGGLLRGEGGGVCRGKGVGDGVFGSLLRRLLGWGLGLLMVGGDQEEVVHAVLGELCEALAEQGSDEVLGAGEVGLEDAELEVEGGIVVHVGGGIGEGGGEVFDDFDLYEIHRLWVN